MGNRTDIKRSVQETYPSAPIIEAVLDIRVRLPKDSAADLEGLQAQERDRYPILRHPFQFNFKLQRDSPDAEPVTQASHTRNGYAFASQDLLQVFQARPDGFSHNRLAPYVSWEAFKGEARRLWEKYSAVAKPEVIELLGLNYINRLVFPAGSEIGEYLATYVNVPAALPQALEAHSLMIQMKDSVSEATIAISVNLAPTERADMVSAVLSIQAFKLMGESSTDVSEESIWNTFETLRNLKNLAFESSITERARATFR